MRKQIISGKKCSVLAQCWCQVCISLTSSKFQQYRCACEWWHGQRTCTAVRVACTTANVPSSLRRKTLIIWVAPSALETLQWYMCACWLIPMPCPETSGSLTSWLWHSTWALQVSLFFDSSVLSQAVKTILSVPLVAFSYICLRCYGGEILRILLGWPVPMRLVAFFITRMMPWANGAMDFFIWP